MVGLKQKRKSMKLTLNDVATKIGVQPSAVCFWETGKRFPRKEMLNKLCEFFNCKIDDLL